MVIKDSGERKQFDTGAVRDMSSGKGRYDLLPWFGVEAVAQVMEEGADKYGERNWEQGIPVGSFCDSASRHLAKFMRGDVDEPHLAQAAWNILCALDTRRKIQLGKLPSSLDNCGGATSTHTASGVVLNASGAVGANPSRMVNHLQCPNIDANCGVSPCVDCDITEAAAV